MMAMLRILSIEGEALPKRRAANTTRDDTRVKRQREPDLLTTNGRQLTRMFSVAAATFGVRRLDAAFVPPRRRRPWDERNREESVKRTLQRQGWNRRHKKAGYRRVRCGLTASRTDSDPHLTPPQHLLRFARSRKFAM